MEKVVEVLTNRNIYLSILILIIGGIIYILVRNGLKKVIYKNKKSLRFDRKKTTFLNLFNSIFKYVMLIVIVVIILQVNGVNVSSIIAGLGMVSVIAGLALQDALKDIIMGFNIILDEYYSVGDVIKMDEIEGKIVSIGIKVTKLEDINNGNCMIIANRNISKALKLSNYFDICIPLPYEEKVLKIEKIIDSMIIDIKELENVTDTTYKGIQEFGDSAIFYKIRVFCNPEFRGQTRRDANRIIKVKLDEKDISIPYMQIDIKNK